ncbi:MAG: hypothetical protein K9G59_12520 [Caulobacter sp.]|nr:hypothetical protein [Caulobacter sp.]
MSGLIDEALRRATAQANEGPRELRAGRYRPEQAATFNDKTGPRDLERGHVPGKVQGGYQPSTSQHGKPPTGGSAVKPKTKT